MALPETPVESAVEYTGTYFSRPEGDSLPFKGGPLPAELDPIVEIFNKMMEQPSPALALALQVYTYEKSIPWQLTSSLAKSALSGVQSLMNGQV